MQSDATKYLFYDFVVRGWDLKDERLSIEYDAAKSPNGYIWSTPPVGGHDAGYNWKETMLWISMAIGHHALCREMWKRTEMKDNILNVKWFNL